MDRFAVLATVSTGILIVAVVPAADPAPKYPMTQRTDHTDVLHGTKVAVLVRELISGERRGQRKVSLRAANDDDDVSRIARAQGGGGHRRAAGFSTTLDVDELVVFLRSEIAAQLGGTAADRAAATLA